MAATVGIVLLNQNQKFRSSEAITTTGSAQTASGTGSIDDVYAEVATSGGDIWVTLNGATPAVGTGHFIPAGTTRTFKIGVTTVIKVFGPA